MRKRLLAYLLALCMVLGMLPMTTFAEEPGGTTGEQESGGTSDSSPVPGDDQQDRAPSTEISQVAIVFNENNARLEIGNPFPTATTTTTGVTVATLWYEQPRNEQNVPTGEVPLPDATTVPKAGYYVCRFSVTADEGYALASNATYTVSGYATGSGNLNDGISSGFVLMNALEQTPPEPPKSTDATLRSLKVSLSRGSDTLLSPAFAAETTEYRVDVPAGTAEVYVDISPAANAKATINGKDYSATSVELTGSATTIKVVVTAEDGKETKFYTVTVNRPVTKVPFAERFCSVGDLELEFNGTAQKPMVAVNNTNELNVGTDKIENGTLSVFLVEGASRYPGLINVGKYPVEVTLAGHSHIQDGTITLRDKFVIKPRPLSAQSLVISLKTDADSDGKISKGDTLELQLAGITGDVQNKDYELSWNFLAGSRTLVGGVKGNPAVCDYTVEDDNDATVTVTAALDPTWDPNKNYELTTKNLSNSFTVGSTPVTATATLKEGAEKITKPYDGTYDLPSGTDLNQFLDLKFNGDQTIEGARIVSGRYNTWEAGNDKTLILTVALPTGDATHTLTSDQVIVSDAAVITKAKPSLTGKAVTVAVDSAVHVEGFYDDSTPLTVESSDSGVVSVYWGPYNNKPSITFAGIKAGTATVKISAPATDNFEKLDEVTFKVTVTAKSSGGGGGGSSGGGGGGGGGSSSGGGSSGGSTNTPTTSGGTTSVGVTPSVSNGSATANVSTSAAQTMVSDAAKNNSDNVTVKVNVPSGSTADSVTANVPASAVASLAKDTNASLTVDSPVADVTIPNSALSALGGTSGNVTVTAAKNGTDSVTVTVQKGGQTVGALTGGMKVNVPVSATAAQAGSGLVAVLVDANGAQTVLPKSTLSGGEMKVLLDSGSATLKFVDNSKSFVDSDTHWASSAVDFVSSRNLFQGTSPTEFSPETPMNRAMLVTVLHRLESEPSASLYSFNDVPTDSYYAEATAWAVGMGITNGMDGAFNGDGTITREMLATML